MRRPDYQNLNDNIEEITDARNAAIRAWGKQQLTDVSDSILIESVRDGGDWDLIEQPVPAEQEIVVIEETLEVIEPPLLSAEVVIAPVHVVDVPVTETIPAPPKAPKIPKTPKPLTS